MAIISPVVDQCGNALCDSIKNREQEREKHPLRANARQFYAEQVENHRADNAIKSVEDAKRNKQHQAHGDSGEQCMAVIRVLVGQYFTYEFFHLCRSLFGFEVVNKQHIFLYGVKNGPLILFYTYL